MLRLYFNHPTIALYMMREFSVQIEDPKTNETYDIGSGLLGVVLSDLEYFFEKEGKIYIAKESESLFEPKEGDEGRYVGRIGASYAVYKDSQWVSHAGIGQYPETIMRQGKHFFQPLKED